MTNILFAVGYLMIGLLIASYWHVYHPIQSEEWQRRHREDEHWTAVLVFVVIAALWPAAIMSVAPFIFLKYVIIYPVSWWIRKLDNA